MDNDLIGLTDPDLFGNEAAEDEDEDTFNSYAYERPELNAFIDPYRKLCFVRAYKGEGKSALLRLTRQRVRRLDPDSLIVDGRGPDLSPPRQDTDFDAWARDWKASLIGKVARFVGATINLAFSDTSMALVEMAEKGGMRERGLVSAILARLGVSFTLSVPGATVEVGQQSAASDPESKVKRWAQGRPPIWILVDDVDQNFANDTRNRVKLAAFFDACRQLSQAIPELRIRAAVRPNVWTTIKYHYESLSHVEQYVTDLEWSSESIRSVLARRVEGYLIRRALLAEVADSLPTESAKRERALIALVFEDPMRWGQNERPPHAVLHTLSKHRPRWVVELCSAAALATDHARRRTVLLDDVFKQLEAFGKKRIADTVAEFRSQCSEVDELIASLKDGEEEYSTDELIDHVKKHITNHLTPHISGVVGNPSPLDVAAFLFEIGVIFGRRDLPDGSYEHVDFSDNPSLLRARTNLDDGLRWEVHPVFRQVLRIRDDAGRHSPSGGRRRVISPKRTRR